jgi:prolyl 4-hydroxylase
MDVRSSAVDHANTLLASGAENLAVAALSDAVRKGDPDAMHLFALWHVYGQPVPRNFVIARKFFGLAGKTGHAESARTHAVFVAIGAGGPADWSNALALLRKAAETDPLAMRQCELLGSMQLRPDGSPAALPYIESLATSPKLSMVRELFTPSECLHIVKLSTPRMMPSLVVDPITGRQSEHPIRTSDGTVLGPIQQDLVIHALNLRIAAATATREEQGEPLSVLRYRAGQQYRLHHDCLPGELNQRVLTVIAYLNENFGEGATRFPHIKLNVRGATGDAIIFHNVQNNGHVDQASQHAGLPISHGEKWICTRWIRQSTFDPWGMRLTV